MYCSSALLYGALLPSIASAYSLVSNYDYTNWYTSFTFEDVSHPPHRERLLRTTRGCQLVVVWMELLIKTGLPSLSLLLIDLDRVHQPVRIVVGTGHGGDVVLAGAVPGHGRAVGPAGPGIATGLGTAEGGIKVLGITHTRTVSSREQRQQQGVEKSGDSRWSGPGSWRRCRSRHRPSRSWRWAGPRWSGRACRR